MFGTSKVKHYYLPTHYQNVKEIPVATNRGWRVILICRICGHKIAGTQSEAWQRMKNHLELNHWDDIYEPEE